MQTLKTYAPSEIHGPGHEKRVIQTGAVLELGQNLLKGTMVGYRPTSKQLIAYVAAAAAATTVPVVHPTISTSGNATSSTVTVTDAHTLTEVVTCTFTTATAFTVVGSISGALGTGGTGTEFKNGTTNANSAVRFTVTAGNAPMSAGDTITFSTTAAGARTAEGVLAQTVDATNAAAQVTIEIAGVWIYASLVGFDSAAGLAMYARLFGNGVYLIA